MKLKYYMRGMGFGIFVTTLIFLIAIAFLKPFNGTDGGSSAADANTSQTVEEAKEETKDVEETTENETDSKKETTVSEDGTVTTVETIPGAEEDEADAAAAAAAEEEVNAKKADADKSATSKSSDSKTTDTTETITITINGGEGSNSVGNKLQQAGAVDSGSRFNRYLEDNNYDNVIQPGTYSVPKGSTYEDIAKIITGR